MAAVDTGGLEGIDTRPHGNTIAGGVDASRGATAATGAGAGAGAGAAHGAAAAGGKPHRHEQLMGYVSVAREDKLGGSKVIHVALTIEAVKRKAAGMLEMLVESLEYQRVPVASDAELQSAAEAWESQRLDVELRVYHHEIGKAMEAHAKARQLNKSTWQFRLSTCPSWKPRWQRPACV